MKLPRIMIAAPSSGSGKTLITCGLLQAFANRGLKVTSFKCGPDYIDPMFHRTVLGIPARNLDTFFTGADMTRYLLGKAAAQRDMALLEGVMGFYDGAGGVTTTASSYELAKVTDTPVILVVNARGMSLSVVSLIQGFLGFRRDSNIAGVILNQVSSSSYSLLRQEIEKTLPVSVFGYVPKCPELTLESRHLGLVMPEEVEGFQEKLQYFAGMLEETLDLEKILTCARTAGELDATKPESLCGETGSELKNPEKAEPGAESSGIQNTCPDSEIRLRIGIARDEAFCFCYEENLELLRELGAEPVFFSPLHDRTLPEHLQGMIFYGGYPELHMAKLSGNQEMRLEISAQLKAGMPFLAECGGFMYLQESMEDSEGNLWPMAGVFPGKAYPTGKLGRFGYLTLTAREEHLLLQPGESIKGHEFHYFDCTENGNACHGKKPFGSREWDCIQGGPGYAAGFPHLYYYSSPRFIRRFLQKCREYAGRMDEVSQNVMYERKEEL